MPTLTDGPAADGSQRIGADSSRIKNRLTNHELNKSVSFERNAFGVFALWRTLADSVLSRGPVQSSLSLGAVDEARSTLL